MQHSAILSSFIKLRFSIKTFVLSIFKWSLQTGFSVVILTEAVTLNTLDIIFNSFVSGFFCTLEKKDTKMLYSVVSPFIKIFWGPS